MMKIKWNDEHAGETTTNIEVLLERGRTHGGQTDYIETRVDNITSFCSEIIELLYKKGVLNKEDIAQLMSPLVTFNNTDEFEIITT